MHFPHTHPARILAVAAAVPLAAASAVLAPASAHASTNSLPAAAVPAHYRVINLAAQSAAITPLGTTALNDRGQVVGYGMTAQGQTDPFLWTDGKVKDLGRLDPATIYGSIALDVNNRAEVVGMSFVGGDSHAFLWRNGAMTDLGTLGGLFSAATGINDRGQVVGYSQTADGQDHAFLWQDGRMTDLGYDFGPVTAFQINNRGQISGAMATATGIHAFLLSHGTLTNLGALAGGYSAATGINDHSWIVGISPSAANPGSLGGFLWYGGKMTELVGSGDAVATPVAINDKDQTLGSSYSPSLGRTSFCIWLPNGSPIDLSSHGIARGGPGSGTSQVTDINDRDQITGTYYVAPGQPEPVLFVPTA